MSLRVALFGLGRVGAGYESIAGMPRCHLAAILASPHLTLAAAVDPNAQRRREAAARFSLASAAIASEFLPQTAQPIDVAVIATPPDERARPLGLALDAGAKVLIVEKPFARTLAEGRSLVAKADACGARIRVNFHRRFDPAMQALKAEARGPLVAVQARYGKGLQNYGSHLLDLLIEWCGLPLEVQALDNGSDEPDPTISFKLTFVSGITSLVLGLRGTRYDVFDVDLLTADTRIEIAAGGAERVVWRTVPNRHYPSYSHLVPDDSASSEGPLGGLTELYMAVAAHLVQGAPLSGCDGAAGLTGLAIREAILQSAEMGGAQVPIAPLLEHTLRLN